MDEIPQQPVTVAQVARVGIDLPCLANRKFEAVRGD